MTLDVPTLMAATTLLLALSSLALTAHWLANLGVSGLRGVALGAVAGALGSYALIPVNGGLNSFSLLAGDLLVIGAHLIIWLSIAAFWGVRTRVSTGWGGMMFGVAVLLFAYQTIVGDNGAVRGALLSGFVAIFSLTACLSLVKALGGRRSLYRGIIKRTSLGGAIAAALFLAHTVFYAYRAYAWQQLPASVSHYSEQGLAIWTQVEAMVFVLMLALTVIIMTAERSQHALKIQAMMDPLTQALSRRAFMTVIKTVVARSKRQSEPVSLIMIDIDRFKRINVLHGRLVGDAVLRQFGERVMSGRRAQDVLCRFGGEEFVLLLPGTDEDGAVHVARLLRAGVCDQPFHIGGKDVSLSLSVGVMTARGDDLVSDGMLDAAYKALKQAQKEGAGQIKLAGTMPSALTARQAD
ncbi:GGDEF domain-containing protein [Kordiimonas sp.]|uniref:GGDEF domain-containing protein n=1 Tax=Kordiimonas sp. TaxID=1970157 RepID=UPI003A925D3C